MLFHTPEFLVLLIVSLLFFYGVPKSRKIVLSVANIIFYGVSGLGFLALFLSVTVINYFFSLQLRGKYKKVFLWATIVGNLANLCFFKYSVLLIQTAEKALGIQLLTTDSFWLSLVLPIGISFYTFEFISYAVDVYQRKTEPTKNLIDFWIFIAFFAHLVAGPIMRGNEFIPQVQQIDNVRLKLDNFKIGSFYLMLGLFKKILFADYLSVAVNNFFQAPGILSGSEAWIGAYLFAFQIYFDFSAYSDMAIGIGYMFGFELPRNFMTPYLSGSATEFWRRWHMTLSTWIRDYIYIPLGGSRKGKARAYFNSFAAMTISGIWHGALWTFVIWGMFHGLLLAVHKLYGELKKKLGITWLDNNIVYKWVSILVFFHLTCIGWIFFRVHSFTDAKTLVGRMLSPEALHVPAPHRFYLVVVVGLFAFHIVENFLLKKLPEISKGWHRFVPSPARALVYVALIVVLVVFLRGDENTFIYFQF